MQTQNSNVFVQTATFNAHMLIALKQKVYELLQANNTITTLEVKLALVSPTQGTHGTRSTYHEQCSSWPIMAS